MAVFFIKNRTNLFSVRSKKSFFQSSASLLVIFKIRDKNGTDKLFSANCHWRKLPFNMQLAEPLQICDSLRSLANGCSESLMSPGDRDYLLSPCCRQDTSQS